MLLDRNRDQFLNQDILELDTKVFTYHWNVAITRFDIICDYVRFFCAAGYNKFHLKSESNRFRIFDLETNNQILPPLAESDMLLYGLLPTDVDSPEGSSSPNLMDDPFGYLRPSKHFPPEIKSEARNRTPERLSASLIAKYRDCRR
jgi:hypothetical protein